MKYATPEQLKAAAEMVRRERERKAELKRRVDQAAAQLISEGMIVESLDADGKRIWTLTEKGINYYQTLQSISKGSYRP
jgi:predicted transcriptional regulator